MKTLIIGGTRFMGARAADMLADAGHEVTCFHRGADTGNVQSSVRCIQGDRQDLTEFAGALRALEPDVVIDMVCLTERNAKDLAAVFEGFARRAVLVSSMDVYRAYGRLCGTEPGPPDPVPLFEDSPLRERLYPYRSETPAPGVPAWMQDYDKILVERALTGLPGFPVTVLRMPAVYGPNDGQHRVGEYLRQMDAKAATIRMSAGQARWRWSRAYVDNAARAIFLAATETSVDGRIYNVAEPLAFSEAEWVAQIGRAAGWDGTVTVAPSCAPEDGANYAQNLVADASRIRRELGYTEIVPPDEVLRRTVEWERRVAEGRSPT